MSKFRNLILLLPALLLITPVAMAAGSAVGTMAGIVMDMNHYPSADETMKLKAIAEDAGSTAGEKQLAMALINMKHSVGDSDAEKLRALSGNMSASDAERELADILLGFNHMASSAQKERLKALME